MGKMRPFNQINVVPQLARLEKAEECICIHPIFLFEAGQASFAGFQLFFDTHFISFDLFLSALRTILLLEFGNVSWHGHFKLSAIVS
jgi:hypothetical protein